MKIIPVILSGGAGERLWPLSRGQFPKQYQSLIGSHTMLQETILRLDGIENLSDPIIICNSDHRFLVAEQLQQINILQYTIILEPIGRNTAPAITAASFYVMQDNQNIDAILLILSADHAIQDVKSFHRAINLAKDQADNGKLATFGIVPTHANIDYGYILANINGSNDFVMEAKSFKEKPNMNLANKYLNENDNLKSQNLPIDWYWNSGMFVSKASTLLSELSLHANDLVTKIKESVENAVIDFDFIRLEEKAFASCQNISIDYALMELSNNVVIVPLDAEWSDVGSWASLYAIGNKDSNSNVIRGDVLTHETSNSYINSSSHTIATIGIDNLVIVDTPDVIFISTKNKSHEAKSIVKELKNQGRDEANLNRKVHRPWGWFDCIEVGKNFQVKRLHVNPGAKLSLQKHYKRAEHWIIVSGLANVTLGEKEFVLNEGQSTYVDIGVIHSLENKTNEMLEIIEVQNGVYLGEDDILRFDDEYGRN
jgi:mannose-1-phosphate guanylyltransferase / mannose-6-phosphate isomerase